MTDAGDPREPPRLAARPVHGHRRPPRRRRLRPGRHGRPLDRRGIRRAGSCAARAATRAARTPTPTRSSWPPCARREQRAAAAIIGYAGVTLPPPARRRAGQRPGPARAARPRDPDVPAGRRPRHRPRDGLLSRRRRSTTPTIGRPGWPRSTPSIRPPATRWRSRGWPATGWRRTASAGSTSSGRTAPDAWVDVGGDARTQDRRPARARAARSTTSTGSTTRIRDVGGRGG